MQPQEENYLLRPLLRATTCSEEHATTTTINAITNTTNATTRMGMLSAATRGEDAADFGGTSWYYRDRRVVGAGHS